MVKTDKDAERELDELTKRAPTSIDILNTLHDPEYQRGPAYRQQKIMALRAGRNQGMTLEQLQYELEEGGLTPSTARAYLRSAFRPRPTNNGTGK